MAEPAPFPVELVPHDPLWAEQAAEEGRKLAAALGPVLVTVHHAGSTSIPGIMAKPVIDLWPVAASLAALDGLRPMVEALGYRWWGEFGLPGRRYCSKDDPETGRRLVQLHFYEAGSREIDRHLAFRDHLRAHPEVARAYEREKIACRDRHPDNSHAYSQCKQAWIDRVEADALNAERDP